jgi:hypothetical protein
MKTMKTIIAAFILTVGSLTLANAQTRFHVSVNTPGVHVSAGNTHRTYYQRGYYQPVAYRHYYHRGYYQPVVYHRYYNRPVYRTYYHRTVYAGPAYHRGFRRW